MSTRKPELNFRRRLLKSWTDDGGRTWTVNATLVFDEGGLRITELQISPVQRKGTPPAITTRVLQRLPLQKWITEFATDKSQQLQNFANSNEWAAMPGLQERLAQVGQGPRTSSVAFYGEVAKVYRGALIAHESPTKAVAERWKVTRTLAATWVHRARKTGLLSKTNQGRAKG
jgi:hypothetical protein